LKEQVIQSRVTPPRSPGNIITRENLINTLSGGRDKKLILVTAPAGYGKTTLISKHAYNSNIRFAWYHANRDASSPYIFFSYIIHALDKLHPGFGSEILNTIKSLNEDSGKIKDIHSAIDEIVYLIAAEFISTFDEKITLIIDDLHEIKENEWLSYAFNKLFEELPQNLQLIITSRHQPDFNISHLRAKREILELTHKNLVFTDDEIRHLSEELYSLNYSNEEVKYLESSLGGWVTGIHMLIQSNNGKITKNELSGKFLPDTLFDFFAGEIFEKLDEDTREFLLTTAHLENFDFEMSDYLLGIDKSEKILSHLLSKNIFIESVQVINEKGNQLTQYNYIQLFRTFLTKKSNQVYSKAQINNIFAKVSSYYAGKDNIEAAIEFAILSGDKEISFGLIKNNFVTLFQNGRFEKLWNWISSYGEEAAEKDMHLLYYKGVLSKYYLGKLDDALLFLDKALLLAGKEDDKDFINDIMISRTEILLNQGKFNFAIDTLNNLEAPGLSPKNSARLYYNLGNAYFYTGNYEKALPYLEKAMAVCKENGIEELLCDIYNIMGNIYINNGEFILSTHYYELTLNRITGIYKKFVVFGNLSLLYSRTAKYEKAKEYYEKTYDIYKLVKSPIFEITIKLTEYTIYFEMGDFLSALAVAEYINNAALKINNITYTYLSYLVLGECNYYLGNREKAGNYYGLAEKYIDEENETDKATLGLFLQINGFPENISPESEDKLLKTYSFLDSKNSNYDKITAGYYLAAYYLASGLAETSLKYLEAALKLAKEKEYNSFLIREYLRSNELFNFAVKNNVLKDTVKNIYLRIMDIDNYDWINPEYRKSLQNKKETLYDIKMTSFGKLEFTVRGVQVDESKWIRKKRKLILAYLFLASNYSLSKDKIIDIFFPDTPLESIDNTFHQAISNLRSALKLQHAVKAKPVKTQPAAKTKKKVKSEEDTEPDYVIYEGKSLMLNHDYNYFSDIGEFDKLTNRAASPECEHAQKIRLLMNAIELYKGDFLSEYYEPWIENIRDEYRNKFIKYSEMLLDLLSAKNDFEQLIDYSQKILYIDKLNEKAYLMSIKSFVETGKKAQAKAAYEKMIKCYDDELSEKPPAALLKNIKEYITV
jgi:LuxR family transcriptional regulator, maltose regulon positive regulatory protein